MFDRGETPARSSASQSRPSSQISAPRRFESEARRTYHREDEFALPTSRPFAPIAEPDSRPDEASAAPAVSSERPAGSSPPVIQCQRSWWERHAPYLIGGSASDENRTYRERTAPKLLGGKDPPKNESAGLARTPREKHAPYLLGGKAPGEDRNYYQRNAWSIFGGKEVDDDRSYWERVAPAVAGGKELRDDRSYWERAAPGWAGGKEAKDRRSYRQRVLPSWAGGKEAQRPINEIHTDFPDLHADYVEDLQKIHDLVRDPEQMVHHLGGLDHAVGDRGRPRDLSAALSAKEQEHGFSDAKVLPLGILPSDKFLDVTRKGYMPKDPGAGLEHGEYTHRLQWNAIMSRFEEDMRASREEGQEGRAWKHTPFELYTAIGERDYQDVEEHGEEGHLSLWGHLMDSAGRDVQETGESLGQTYPKGFSQPDAFTAFLNTEAIEGGEHLPNIAGAVHERYRKRAAPVRELEREAVARHQEVTRHVEEGYVEAESLPSEEKARRDKELNRMYTDSSTASQQAMEKARETAAAEYAEKKMGQDKYEPMDPNAPEEQLLIRQGDERMTADEVKRRRRESRKVFGLE